MTTEPGFECPECGAQLYQAARCAHCGWAAPTPKTALEVVRLHPRDQYVAPAPTEVTAFMKEIRQRLGIKDGPEDVKHDRPGVPLSDSCGHATPEECERDAANWYRMQARQNFKPRRR